MLLLLTVFTLVSVITSATAVFVFVRQWRYERRTAKAEMATIILTDTISALSANIQATMVSATAMIRHHTEEKPYQAKAAASAIAQSLSACGPVLHAMLQRLEASETDPRIVESLRLVPGSATEGYSPPTPIIPSAISEFSPEGAPSYPPRAEAPLSDPD